MLDLNENPVPVRFLYDIHKEMALPGDINGCLYKVET